MRLILSSEEDNEKQNDQHFSINGTNCTLKNSNRSYNWKSSTSYIYKELPSPMRYAKRNIMKGKIRTAFSLIIEAHAMKHLRIFTTEQLNRVLEIE